MKKLEDKISLKEQLGDTATGLTEDIWDKIEEIIEQDAEERHLNRANEAICKVIECYRKTAMLDESIELQENNLDDIAMRKTATEMNIDEATLKDYLLNYKLVEGKLIEGTTLNQVLDDINADTVITEDSSKGDIEQILDDALVANKRLQRRNANDGFINVLFVGDAGTGKTSRVREWANKNGINLMTLIASKLDDVDLGGAVIPSDPDEQGRRYAKRLSTSEFDLLNKPNSVLFLDEYNRAKPSVRAPLFELINHHTLDDRNEPDGLKHFPNFLFTIAAINPSDFNYDTDALDPAEISRFKTLDIYGDPKVTLNWFLKDQDKAYEIAKKDLEENPDDKEALWDLKAIPGRKELAKKLLTAPYADLHFDTREETAKAKQDAANSKFYQPRTLTYALLASNGTKGDFLKNFKYYCNLNKFKDVERVLANYQDVEDKATDALKNHETQSKVFKSKTSAADAIRAKLGK